MNRGGAEKKHTAMIIDESLRRGLIEAALAASAEIMRIYATDFAVAAKGDASPVTEADQRAEAIILDHLGRLLPGVPVIAEEQVAAGEAPTALGDLFVLVDPLDGTKEFVSRNGEFTVNIGLVASGRPIAGVVAAPALGEIFEGVVGVGARAARIVDGKAVDWHDITVRDEPETGLVVLASRSHGGGETETILNRCRVATRIDAGSSLKFCRLAEGAADFYPRLGRTMEWDTAAGDAVLTAAGGTVIGTDGRPFVYGKRGRRDAADFANPGFLAAGGYDVAPLIEDAARNTAAAAAEPVTAPDRSSAS